MTSLVRNHDSLLLAVYILGGWHEAWKDTAAAPNFNYILDFNPESGRSWAVLTSTYPADGVWHLIPYPPCLLDMHVAGSTGPLAAHVFSCSNPGNRGNRYGHCCALTWLPGIQLNTTKAFWQPGSALSFCGTTAWTVEVQLRIPRQGKGRFLVRWNHSWPLILLSEVQQRNVYGVDMYLCIFPGGDTSCIFSCLGFDVGSVNFLGPWI